MKIGLKGISALSFVMAAAFVGCGKPPVESFCAKQVECGATAGQTEEQCVANTNTGLEALRKDAGCKEISGSFDGLLGCSGGLSCAELKSDQGLLQKCSDEFGDLIGAVAKEQMTCKTPLLPGFDPGSATDGTGDGT